LEKIFLDQNIQIGMAGAPAHPLYLGRTHMGLEWQRDFVAVVLDMMNGDLYWYDNLEAPANRLVKIPKGREFLPAAYTKEKMLLLVCNAHFNTSAGVTPTNIAVPEVTAEVAAAAAAAASPAAPPSAPVAAGPPVNATGASPVTPSATPTPVAPAGGRHPHLAQEVHKQPPSILGPQPPSDADIQKVVSAFLTYQKSYQEISQQIQDLSHQADTVAQQKQEGIVKINAIKSKSSAALTENEKALSDYASADDAKNASLIYDDAINSAVAFTSDDFPKISDQIDALNTRYKAAGFDVAMKTLNTQYNAIFDAVFAFANNTPDVLQLTKLLKANPQPYPDKVQEWQALRKARISSNETAIKDAADTKLQRQDSNSVTFHDLKEPKALANQATDLAALLKGISLTLRAAVKDMVKTLNDDYVKSRVYIVIPVPNVSSNSLQLFSLTVTDNYKPLVWTDPSPTNAANLQDNGTCPKGCIPTCPGATCPSASLTPPSAQSPTPGTPTPAGVGLQVTAIRPGGAATISSSPVQVSQQVDGAGNVAITASFIVPFHRIVHFAADGGFLAALISSNSYTAETLPDTIVTTTTTTTTTSTGTTVTETIVSWYPLGRDSFAVSRKAKLFNVPATYMYSRRTLAQQLAPGLLLATAVNTAGTFVAAPVWDIAPGVSLFGGLTLADKTSLAQSITLCSSLGSSTSTAQYGPTTVSSGGTTVVTQVQVQTTTGCSNAKATMLSGTTVPTSMGIKPGFGFGIVFNSSLFSYFGGKN
jgi:hypothetical protein